MGVRSIFKPVLALSAIVGLLLIAFIVIRQNNVSAAEVEQCNDERVKATIFENGWRKPFLAQAEFARRVAANKEPPQPKNWATRIPGPAEGLGESITPEGIQNLERFADAIRIVNVRQRAYDAENNIRHCAAQMEFLPSISLEERQKMAASVMFMMQFEMLAKFGAIPKDQLPMPSICVDPKKTLIYKIERLQDSDTFMVTWDCPGQIRPY